MFREDGGALKRWLTITILLICAVLFGVLWYVERLESTPVERPWDRVLASRPQALPPALQAERAAELSSQSRTLAEVKQRLDAYQEPIKSLTKEAKESVKKLAELRAAVETGQSQLSDLEALFPTLEEHWRALVVRAEASARTQPDFSQIPVLPPFADELYSGIAQSSEAHHYLELYRQSYELSEKRRRQAANAWRAEVAGEFSELLRWHRLRSLYLAELIRLGAPELTSWTPENLQTMEIEVGLIPYRFSVLGIVKEAQVEHGVLRPKLGG